MQPWRIRRAEPRDFDAVIRLLAELVDDPPPDRPRFDRDLVDRLLVVDQGSVVALALFEIIGPVGYVRSLITDRTVRRRGIGLAMMRALRERFRTGGATTWCLNVATDNTPARALYERCGLAPAYETTVVRIGRALALPDPEPTLRIEDIAAGDDAEVERVTRLLPGQLASARRKGGRTLLRLIAEGNTAGVAVWSPTIPGAHPFRVLRPEHAPTFVTHLRTLSVDRPFVQLVIDDDPALAAQIVGTGADVTMRLVHLRGSLDVDLP